MRRMLVGIVLLLVCDVLVMAQSARKGSEFRVNTYTTGNQAYSRIAMREDGEFVVVWQSGAQDGSYYGVFAQRFDSTGTPLGGEIQVNAFTTGHQFWPSVAMLNPDGFVVVWGSDLQDGSSTGMVGRLFQSTGSPVGGDFPVNTYTTGQQVFGVVAADPFGGFVVTWEGAGQSSSGGGIFARMFDSTAAPVGGDFQINTYTMWTQGAPSIAVDSAGNFVVAWWSNGQGGDYTQIFARRFDSTGDPVGDEFQVNVDTAGYHGGPAAAVDDAGNFVVSWWSYGYGHALGNSFIRRYDSGGSALGGEFQVNTYTTGYQTDPHLAMEPGGGFVVTWDSDSQDGFGMGTFARSFDSDGTPLEVEFQVNSHTTGNQARPAVAMGPTGDFVVTWNSRYQDGSSGGIFGQRHCRDTDSDALCNDEDILVSSPTNGSVLDCSDVSLVSPTIEWVPGNYEKFRVFLSPDPSFDMSTRVTSGDSYMTGTEWTPSAKKWRAACKQAFKVDPNDPVLHIEVLGVDTDLPKKDPRRKTSSQIVQLDVQP